MSDTMTDGYPITMQEERLMTSTRRWHRRQVVRNWRPSSTAFRLLRKCSARGNVRGILNRSNIMSACSADLRGDFRFHD